MQNGIVFPGLNKRWDLGIEERDLVGLIDNNELQAVVENGGFAVGVAEEEGHVACNGDVGGGGGQGGEGGGGQVDLGEAGAEKQPKDEKQTAREEKEGQRCGGEAIEGGLLFAVVENSVDINGWRWGYPDSMIPSDECTRFSGTRHDGIASHHPGFGWAVSRGGGG